MQFPTGTPMMSKHQIDLTPLGRQKLEVDNIGGDRGEIMWYLKQHGRSSLREIAEKTGIVFPKVKGLVNEMSGKYCRWLEWC